MRSHLTLILSILTFSASAQSTDTYKSEQGKYYSQEQFNKVWYQSGNWVELKCSRDEQQFINFSILHVDSTELTKKVLSGQCKGRRKKTSVDAIRKLNFYSEVASIKLTSFRPLYDSSHGSHVYEMPNTNGKPNLALMTENISLHKTLENLLLDILVNYDYKTNGEVEVTMCYDPRNAIVFLGKDEKIIGYIEICFECHDFRRQGNNIKLGAFCDEKFEMLRQIFMAAGVKYGMNPFEY
jgi:hypothetical protein